MSQLEGLFDNFIHAIFKYAILSNSNNIKSSRIAHMLVFWLSIYNIWATRMQNASGKEQFMVKL